MQDPKTAGFDVAVNLSKQTIGTSHPAALRLDRAGRSGCAPSTYSNDQGHNGVVYEAPGGRSAARRRERFGSD